MPELPLVVMGIAGAGKTTLAEALAARLGRSFVEGDALHSAEAVAKMRSGEPLDDTDRAPWLANVAAALTYDPRVVVTCSALRRRYRDRLRAAGELFFVHVQVPAEVARERVGRRPGHFMPAALVDSQLAALEPLARDENGIGVDGTLPVAEQVAAVVSSGVL